MAYRNIMVVGDYNDMSAVAAKIIIDIILEKPDCVLGLPTGKTPAGMYGCLTQLLNDGKVDLSRVCTYNLDEYVGLGPDDKESFHYYMNSMLFSRTAFSAANTHIPNGLAADPEAECGKYEDKLKRSGKIDLLVVGIGINGHIGFNEPGSDFKSRVRVVELAETTRKINARYFKSLEQVPRRAITMGLQNIMEAKRVLLIAGGNEKAPALARAFNGPVSEQVPASVLQRHDDLTVIADRKAAGDLSG